MTPSSLKEFEIFSKSRKSFNLLNEKNLIDFDKKTSSANALQSFIKIKYNIYNMLEKEEKYKKLYDSFLDFIRKNLELNDLVYKVDSSIPSYYKVGKFIKENSICNNTLSGLIDELNSNGFIKCVESKYTKTRTLGIETKNTEVKKQLYFVTFKVFSNNINDKTIFFAREFDNDETKRVYIKIKTKLEMELNLKLVMLEDDKAAGNIHFRIKNEIKFCKYFIADLTYKNNPKESGTINGNVMFEIGMAIAYNKPCLLIMNNSVYPFVENNQNKNLPFDITSHTTIAYPNENDEYIESILKCVALGVKNKL